MIRSAFATFAALLLPAAGFAQEATAPGAPAPLTLAPSALAPGTLSSQGTGPALGFTLSAGVQARPSYFGSDSYEAGPSLGISLDYARIGGLTFGSPDPLFVPEGLNFNGSFRLIDERSADDDPELTGLADIDTSLELGGGVSYATRDYRVFGNVRYGVIGHESFVGELGADIFARPNDQLTVRAGPRLLFGSEDYVNTYFGVTPAEAAASAFPAYSAGGGLVSAGVEVGLGYRFNDSWGLNASLRADRLTGDAADSPIIQTEDQVTATIGVTRRFTFGF